MSPLSGPPKHPNGRRADHGGRGHRGLARVLALTAAVALLAGAPAAHAKTLIGTAGPDHLTGGTGPDLIYAGGGRDALKGRGGDDIIYGVRSDNTIKGGSGDNYIEGGTGADTITALDGDNTVYGGTGPDRITLGNGNNYVDPGAARDTVALGNGNNVVNAGAGGLVLTAGSGNNTVYYRSGPDDIRLGNGVNRVYIGTMGQFARIDCGGNPGSVLYVPRSQDPTLAVVVSAEAEHKVIGCPTIELFDGPGIAPSVSATMWERFALVGTDGPDHLYGGHGGGTIDAQGGDNLIWADRSRGSGGAAARAKLTTISAGDGNNVIFGGRGTTKIRVGNGRNFIRGGRWANSIHVGTGRNVIRLAGGGRNRVTITGGSSYIESFTRHAPKIHCAAGAKATIVYGERRPITNCKRMISAGSALGRQLQVRGLEHIQDSDPVVFAPISPGAPGVGVARPPFGG